MKITGIKTRTVMVIGFATGLLAGCGSTYLNQSAQLGSPHRLESNAVAYVSVSDDGRYGDITYNDSGRMVTQTIRGALLRHISEVDVGENPEPIPVALTSARQHSASYLIYPTIVHWEDRATEWSGKPDRVEVVITIYDAKSGNMIERSTIGGKSSWFTMGGDHPQDLLPKPINTYFDDIF